MTEFLLDNFDDILTKKTQHAVKSLSLQAIARNF